MPLRLAQVESREPPKNWFALEAHPEDANQGNASTKTPYGRNHKFVYHHHHHHKEPTIHDIHHYRVSTNSIRFMQSYPSSIVSSSSSNSDFAYQTTQKLRRRLDCTIVFALSEIVGVHSGI